MTRLERIKKMSKEEFKDWLIELSDCKLCKYKNVNCLMPNFNYSCEEGIDEYLSEEVNE